MIVDSTQCSDDINNLGNTILSGQCGIYDDNKCKLKCSVITRNDDEECWEKNNECFLLKGKTGETNIADECVDAVCVIIIIMMMKKREYLYYYINYFFF
jgi:sporulation protein YlmC with PRC-barrel domain